MNEMIRVPQVRLIGEDGEQLGITDTEEALAKALADNLDLVEISPTAQPPVCRIMDLGKYKYQQQKKIHDQKRKHHGVEMKQLRIKSFRIDPHDVKIKLKKARQFIEAGHRLLFTLMFRAREHSHADLAESLLKEQFADELADVAKVDSPPRKEGRKMTMTLSPLPNIKQIMAQREREAERKKKEETEASAVADEGARQAVGVEAGTGPDPKPEPDPDPEQLPPAGESIKAEGQDLPKND